jgi:hypothetical protein
MKFCAPSAAVVLQDEYHLLDSGASRAVCLEMFQCRQKTANDVLIRLSLLINVRRLYESPQCQGASSDPAHESSPFVHSTT